MYKGFGMMPNEVLYDDSISDKAKLLYVTISGLCAEKGYCWASNKYIAEKFNTSARTISRRIGELSNYINVETENKGKSSEKRYIKLKDKNVYPPTTNLSTPPRQKCLTNNINNNNINIINKLSIDNSAVAIEIYNHYIKKAKAIGSYNTKYNKKALGLERITKAIKLLGKDRVLDVVNNYYKQNRDEISKGYVKMVQYFFGPVALGSKVMYYDDYIIEGKEKKKPVDVDNLAF